MFGALGVLTKGIFAILLPAAVSITFFGLTKRWKDLRSLFFNPVGLLVFGLIVIPWYLAEFMLHGEAFLIDLFLLQGSEAYNYNFIGSSLPYYSYLFFIFIGLLPFSAMFIKAIVHIRKLMSDDLMKFMLLWFLMALLLLPLAQPKSLFSLAYCFPPLFVIMARASDIYIQPITLFIWPLLFMVFLLLAPYMAPYIAGSIENDFVRNILASGVVYFDTFYQMTLGAVILLFAVLPFIKPIPASVKYSVLGLLFVSMVNFLVLPILGNILQQPIKSAALLAKKENLEVVTWRINPPSFNVYAEMLTEKRKPKGGEIVLTKSDLREIKVKYEKLYEKHGVILARILETPANNSLNNNLIKE
jgi:hypothetical protein